MKRDILSPLEDYFNSKKHVKLIKNKMKENRRLLIMVVALEPLRQSPMNSSVQHFLSGGKINGSFMLAIQKGLQGIEEYEQSIKLKEAISKAQKNSKIGIIPIKNKENKIK